VPRFDYAFQSLVTPIFLQIEAKFASQASAKSTELGSEAWVEFEFELRKFRHGLGSVHVVREQGSKVGVFKHPRIEPATLDSSL